MKCLDIWGQSHLSVNNLAVIDISFKTEKKFNMTYTSPGLLCRKQFFQQETWRMTLKCGMMISGLVLAQESAVK